MTILTRLAVRTAAFCFFSYSVLAPGAVFAEGSLEIPTWTDLFNPDGTLKDAVDAMGAPGANQVPDCADPPYAGIDAIFVGDWISDGVATDMSALSDAENLEDVIVWNGTVRTEHDVGNAFVFATSDGAATPNLVLYGAAERFGTASGDGYVEFEFNQAKVNAISRNRPLAGSRTDDDVLVRLNLSMGALSSAEIKRWISPGGYQVVATITATPGTACSGDGLNHLACDPYLQSGQFDYDAQFVPWDDYPRDLYNAPVQVSEPNGLLEFGINVGALIGTNPDYTSILVRTPEDIILANFRNLGYWASANSNSSGN